MRIKTTLCKRGFALLLSLMMCLSPLQGVAFAEETDETNEVVTEEAAQEQPELPDTEETTQTVPEQPIPPADQPIQEPEPLPTEDEVSESTEPVVEADDENVPVNVPLEPEIEEEAPGPVMQEIQLCSEDVEPESPGPDAQLPSKVAEFIDLVNSIQANLPVTDADRAVAEQNVQTALGLYASLNDIEKTNSLVVSAYAMLTELTTNSSMSATINKINVVGGDCYYLYWTSADNPEDIMSPLATPKNPNEHIIIDKFAQKDNKLGYGGYDGYVILIVVPQEGYVLENSNTSGDNQRYTLEGLLNARTWPNEESVKSKFEEEEWYQSDNMVFSYSRLKKHDFDHLDIGGTITAIRPELSVSAETIIAENISEVKPGDQVTFKITITPQIISGLTASNVSITDFRLNNDSFSVNDYIIIDNGDGTYTADVIYEVQESDNENTDITVNVAANVTYSYDMALTSEILTTSTTVTSSATTIAPLRPKYNVQFYPNIDRNVSELPSPQTVYRGDSASIPAPPGCEGYTFSGWYEEANCISLYDFTTKVTANVDLYAKWTPDPDKTKELSYTVEYYKNGEKVELDSQTEERTVQVLEPNTLTVDRTKINTSNKYAGYRFEKTEPETIPNNVNSGDIIKVYYVTDPVQTKELSYTVEYYKDNIKKSVDVVEKTVHVLEPDRMTVIVSEINTVDKFGEDYKCDIQNTVIPVNIDSGGVIKVYYIPNPDKTKELSYTVEYYKNGEKVESDTQTVKSEVQILEPDTLTVDKTAINLIDKYTGYKFEKTDPATIPDSVNNGDIIKVYYVTDPAQTKELTYTVEYYKGEELADTDTVTKSVQWLEDTLPVDPVDTGDSRYEGYTFLETDPEVLPDVIAGGGVIKVIYAPQKTSSPDPSPVPGPTPDPAPERDPVPVFDPIPTPAPTPVPASNPGTTTISDENPPLSDFSDSLTTIADEEVPLASAIGLNNVDHFAYIIGYDNDLVRPTANITRAEVATIFFRLMTEEFRSANWAVTNDFSDVSRGAWYNNAVSTCACAGLVSGYQDGTFRADQEITRAEFAAVAARFLGDEYTGDKVGDFSDTAGHWAAVEIRRAAEAGWVTGSGNAFRPNDKITRAEVMTIVNRMLDRVPDAGHMLESMKKWSDNPEGEWYYEAVQEATNEHVYERDELGVTETWTELLTVRDWKALETEWAVANAR